MCRSDRWYFTKDQLNDTPSRKCGIDAEKELSYRQQAANFIQDMGQRLQVTQLCINTAIVYMHRFYVFHSFSKFHRNAIAACAIFLAAKVEEQPRKLEHVIKVAHFCLNSSRPNRSHAGLEARSPEFIRQANELVVNENIMLQTLGFDIGIEHPHTSVVKCCQLVRASKDLAQTSYFMATNSLHLTTMCLQYRPTVVACVCIHLACKWASWEIPLSNEGKDWFFYVDSTVTLETLETLTTEFLAILDRCPSRLRRRVLSTGVPPSQREGLNSSTKHNSSTNISRESNSQQPLTSGIQKNRSLRKETSVPVSSSYTLNPSSNSNGSQAIVRKNSNSSGEIKNFNSDSFQSNGKDDSLDLIKRKPHNELKMEFSDNESNQSPTMNLSSISSLMMPQQNGYSETGQIRDNVSPTKDSKPIKSSFMSIFTNGKPIKPQQPHFQQQPQTNQFSTKEDSSLDVTNHISNFNTYNSMVDYQQNPSKIISSLSSEDDLNRRPLQPVSSLKSVVPPSFPPPSANLPQSQQQVELPSHLSCLPNQLPPPVALDLPPLPSNFVSANMKSEPQTSVADYSNNQAISSMSSLTSLPLLEVAPSTSAIAAPAIQQNTSHSTQHVPASQSELAMLLERNSNYPASSKSKEKEKDRYHEKHHKHHKEKKHKHKSKDKHKGKHKEKNLTVLAVEQSDPDDMVNNNTPIRIKLTVKPSIQDLQSVANIPSTTPIGGDVSDQNKGIPKLRIAKASLSSSSNDRKRRTSPKDSRNPKLAKLNDS